MDLRCLLGRHIRELRRVELFKFGRTPYRLEYTQCTRCAKLRIRCLKDN